MNKITLITFQLVSFHALAQDSTHTSLTFSGYAEAYYQYDFNEPEDNTRPAFIYSHNRHNEFNLNLGFIKMTYAASGVRANLAVGVGTYMNANYASEPGVLKNILEGNVGVRIGKKNLWIDVGIMPSHIGFESAVSKDCWTLTRSMPADNSPYFESGAKITYHTDNKKWLLSGLLLNGWQRITRVNGNSLMSWATQIQFKPSSKLLFNHSSFIGTDKPDSARLIRLFHNFYALANVTDKFEFAAGFDMGTEEEFSGSENKNTWFSPVLIFRYSLNDKWKVAARGEYYSDRDGVIIASGNSSGFKTTGFSLNLDHSPLKNLLVRVEARNLHSNERIFERKSTMVKNNTFITSSVAVSF